MTHFPENEQPIISSHYLSEEHPPFAGAIITAAFVRAAPGALHSSCNLRAPARNAPKPILTHSVCTAPKTGGEFLPKKYWVGISIQTPKLGGNFYQILKEQRRIGDGRETNLEPPQWVSQIWISVKKPACFRSCTEKILRWKALSL